MDAKFALGLIELDSQHTYFFGLLDQVEEVSAKHVGAALEPLIGELIRYAEFHFASEEALMVAYGYPSEGHKADHAMLIARARSMLGDKDLRSTSLRLFLYNWITNHIELEDRDLAAFVLKTRVELNTQIRSLLAK